MLSCLRAAGILLVLFTLLLGLTYPLAMTGLASAAFPRQAGGSLLTDNGTVIGSALIGQAFASDGYFHPRPSASGHDAMASGGSNLGPLSKRLRLDIPNTPAILKEALDVRQSLQQLVRV